MTCTGWVRSMARFAALAALMAPTMAALGHGQGTMTPGDGASLERPPEAIIVRFDTPVQVTELKVTGPDGPVGLASTPSTEASKHVEVEPAEPLSAGEYTVQWRALGADGHPFSGTRSFSVRD